MRSFLTCFAHAGTPAPVVGAEARLTKPRFDDPTNATPPSLTFTNLKGNTPGLRSKPLEPPVKDECLLNGKPMRYDLIPLLHTNGAPHPSGGTLTLQAGTRTLVYDFKKWAISYTPPKP